MAIVSDVEIRLRADIARLQQDMDRARQSVTSTMSRITSVAKGAMGALAAIGGVAIFAGFVKSAVDAMDAVSDISQRTGIAIKDIAGLQLWFQVGGAEAGEFESSMIKLAKTIATNGDAFKKIGVSTRDANGALRSNVDVLLESGDAFAKMQDGTAKTALAIELFGKSGATLIPILNSGSEGLREMTEMADKLGLTFDQKTSDSAGKFNDTLDFLGLAMQGVGRKVAAELLPSLNSLVGSFLEFIVKSDGVRKAASAIATAFKVIYTAGVTVMTLFTTLGKVIGGTMAFIGNNLSTLFTALRQGIEGDYAKAWQTITSGGRAAGSILSNTFSDVKTELSAAATTISDVWTGAGGETIAALAATQKASKHITDEERKNAEKLAQSYRDLIRSLEERAAASGREADGLSPLNEAEKDAIKLTQDLADKKLVLTATQEARARSLIEENRANLASIESQKALVKMHDMLNKAVKEVADARASNIKTATEEAERNEELANTFGMTAVQIERLELARLKDQLAQRSSKGLTLDEIEDLERLIELKERSVNAVANTQAMQETKDFWSDIEKTAHDTFVSIADGGKDAFSRLKDTAKNMFFDWLYQQTLKKWIINIQAGGTGGGAGAAGWLDAGKTMLQGFGQNLSSTIGGAISKLGSAFGSEAVTSFGSGISSSASAGGIAGAIVAGMMANNKFYDQGWRIDGQVGDIIKSQMQSMFKGNGLAPITAIMTASMAGFEKVLKGIGVNGKLASMISGSAVFARAFGRKAPAIEAEGLRGSITAGGFTGEAFANILEKGGWFRSNKRYTKGSPLGTEQEGAFDETVRGISDSIKAFSQILGAETAAIDGYSKQINIVLTKDEEENQRLIDSIFSGIGDELAQRVLPSITQFQLKGETTSATLQRLATNFIALDAVMQEMGVSSATAFRATGVASIEARERLVALAGGIESLAGQAQFFADNFMTGAQKFAPLQRQVTEQLAAMGYAGIFTATQFRVAVEDLQRSGALATEAGAKTYAGLLALAPAYKAVTDAMLELKRTDADAAMQNLQRAVDYQRNSVETAYESVMTALRTRLDGVSDSISRMTELSRDLKGALLGVEAAGADSASRQVASAEIAAALAIAKAGGTLPSVDDLRDALSAVGRTSADEFGSMLEYQRTVAQSNAQLNELGGLTDAQLDTAELQLRALEAQQAQAESAHAAEMGRLDGILSNAQLQLDAANDINTSIMAVGDASAAALAAIRGLSIANGGYGGVALPSMPPAVPVVAAPPQSGTIPAESGLLDELRRMNERLGNIEVSNNQMAADNAQLTRQFNDVTAGGNALLTEAA